MTPVRPPAYTVDRTPRPCQHKQAQHKHGQYATYTLDSCRCLQCTEAKTVYERKRSRQKAYGRWAPYVDAAPARAHVRALMDAGVGLKRISRLSGVSQGCLWKLMYGKRDGTGTPRLTASMRQDTVDRLLKVGARDHADGARVNVTGAHRRLQALVVLGWSQAKLAARLDVGRSNFGTMMAGEQITVATARRITALYEQLWNSAPPESTHRDKIAASRARNLARARGWAPPLAWDDIDNDEAPDFVGSADAGLDEIAIERIMAGTLQVPLNTKKAPELIEAVLRLHRRGLTDRDIGLRVGRSPGATLRIRTRNDTTSLETPA